MFREGGMVLSLESTCGLKSQARFKASIKTISSLRTKHVVQGQWELWAVNPKGARSEPIQDNPGSGWTDKEEATYIEIFIVADCAFNNSLFISSYCSPPQKVRTGPSPKSCIIIQCPITSSSLPSISGYPTIISSCTHDHRVS